MESLEQLRRRQNDALLRTLEAEASRELERDVRLHSSASGPDHKRLVKLLELEREAARRDIRALTEEHELELADKMAELGVDR